MSKLHNPAHPEYDLKESVEFARALFERKFEEAQRGDWQDAPFPCDEEQAKVYHGVRADLLLWVLEMMPAKDSSGYPEPIT